jgi:para-aminobenzoate synthetase component 1
MLPSHQDGGVGEATASVAGLRASGLLQVSDRLADLSAGGRWAVALPYRGSPVLARFAEWGTAPAAAGRWQGPDTSSWRSSVDESRYVDDVDRVREEIAAGEVYQVNLCRVLTAEMPDSDASDVSGLHALLQRGNPAPFGGYLNLPDEGVGIASASPELFVSVTDTTQGRVIRSGPIKGTGRTEADLQDKDRAENVMIVDLVRNDLSRVSVPGTVSVPDLLRVEQHPGLVHLVSTVEGVLRPNTGWPEIHEAAFPPGSVTGAPKLAAMKLIDRLEPASREFYCGAFGWIDADTGEAELAVAIRTFWLRDRVLRFGTGAGITWGSDPQAEWDETVLKASRLIDVAAGEWPGGQCMES